MWERSAWLTHDWGENTFPEPSTSEDIAGSEAFQEANREAWPWNMIEEPEPESDGGRVYLGGALMKFNVYFLCIQGSAEEFRLPEMFRSQQRLPVWK